MAGQLIETPHGCKIPVPGTAYLSGRYQPEGQPPQVLKWLHLLVQPGQPCALHRLRHGTRVNVSEMTRQDDTVWFYVRNGRRGGWVSWLFVSDEVVGNDR